MHRLRSLLVRVGRSLVDPPIRFIDRRITEHGVKCYHRDQWRTFRNLAAQEQDPQIARWFEEQARAHRRFAE